MFPDDSCQSAQCLVDLSRARKHGRNIGLEDHDSAARRVARRVFVGSSAAEVVLGKYLVDVAPASFSNFALFSLHNLSAHVVSPAAR